MPDSIKLINLQKKNEKTAPEYELKTPHSYYHEGFKKSIIIKKQLVLSYNRNNSPAIITGDSYKVHST